MTLLSHLRTRGCIHDISDAEGLDRLLSSGPTTFYCGFDPTSDSLHVGSMLPLVLMRRLQRQGHVPLVLLGTATGMIGDPSGKSQERQLLNKEVIAHNAEGIARQVGRFLSADGPNGYRLVQNGDWLSSVSLLDFLRDVGKLFSVNAMIAKESVRSRLEQREQGISYTEFSYMLLQAYDFLWLNETYGCRLQVGGSDQWGNITAGMDLIRRKSPAEHPPVFGMTFPLLTTSAGTKFGKTEKGAVWLDPAKTSPYQFYQYWLNTADADVVSYLSLFTDVDDEELERLRAATEQSPDKREAQRRLAAELTTLVHSEQHTRSAQAASDVLFGGTMKDVSSVTLLEIFKDVPSTILDRSEIQAGLPFVDLVVRAGAAQSKGAARRLIEAGGIYLNNERLTELQGNVEMNRFIDETVLVLRSGKKSYYLLRLQ